MDRCRDWTDPEWEKSVEYLFSKSEILVEMIKNVKIVIIYAFKSKFYQYFVFTKKVLHRFVSFCISLID